MLVLLIGCPWVDRDDLRDRDGDGFAAAAYAGDDCNDGDAAVGAPTLMTYLDADADGFGDPGSGALVCVQGERVLDGSDCDDANAGSFPVELWPDDDGDGAGSDALGPSLGCEGGTWGGGDCDDDNPLIRPGAFEDCFDGIDQDCDGASDDCGAGAPIGRGVGTGTQFGQAGIIGADLDGDGLGDLVIGVPTLGALVGLGGGAATSGIELTQDDILLNGQAFGSLGGTSLGLCDLFGDDSQVLVSGAPAADGATPILAFLPLPATGVRSPTFWMDGQGEEPYSALGTSVVVGDIDDDGSPEVIAGDPNEGYYCGGAYVIRTPLPNTVGNIGSVDDYYNDGSLGGVVRLGASCSDYADPVTSERLGSTVALVAAPDGTTRIVLAAPTSNRRVEDAGHVILVGGDLGDIGTINLSATDNGGVAGLDGGAGFGQRLVSGDLDGDGAEELLISAPAATGDVADGGMVYILFDAADATDGAWVNAESVALTLRGNTSDARFGAGLAVLDQDGDGRADVAVGVPQLATGLGNGAVALFYGPFAAQTRSLADADRFWAAEVGRADLGEWLTGGALDDVAGDELIAGAPGEGNGAIYLLR